jgi:uncharacterized protein YjiS (DUF1127 family)
MSRGQRRAMLGRQNRRSNPMFERIREWRGRARSVAEVAAMNDHDLADLGLGRDQALKLAAAPADTVDRRMEKMAAIFAVDGALLHHDHGTMMALAETCADCRERGACGAALAADAARPGSVAASECGFCANARDYLMLRSPG